MCFADLGARFSPLPGVTKPLTVGPLLRPRPSGIPTSNDSDFGTLGRLPSEGTMIPTRMIAGTPVTPRRRPRIPPGVRRARGGPAAPDGVERGARIARTGVPFFWPHAWLGTCKGTRSPGGGALASTVQRRWAPRTVTGATIPFYPFISLWSRRRDGRAPFREGDTVKTTR